MSLPGTGWRLPTEHELTSIVDYGAFAPAIDTTVFPGTGYSYGYGYWSSTAGVLLPSEDVWIVRFDDGYAAYGYKPDDTGHTRCVRGAERPSVFTDNGDGTVTDLVTGLVWQKQGDNLPRTWEPAISYCEALTLGGASDWRLPNIKELLSVVDYSHASPAIDANFFPATPAEDFWSSTTAVGNSQYAWFVRFTLGACGNYEKTTHWTSYRYVRCVRGP